MILDISHILDAHNHVSKDFIVRVEDEVRDENFVMSQVVLVFEFSHGVFI
jgi:hypothetical protein